jgi:hypothetical protein
VIETGTVQTRDAAAGQEVSVSNDRGNRTTSSDVADDLNANARWETPKAGVKWNDMPDIPPILVARIRRVSSRRAFRSAFHSAAFAD